MNQDAGSNCEPIATAPVAARTDRPFRFSGAMAGAWGFAEATLFFIVPDVLLTWIALRDGRAAWRACLWALAGALIGGVVMYTWGAYAPASTQAALDRIPAINAAMIETVRQQLAAEGALALARGPIGGVPYKIYAAQAGASDVPFWLFLVVSLPARFARFAAITCITILACRIFPTVSLRVRRVIHIALWTAFYAWYFWLSGGM